MRRVKDGDAQGGGGPRTCRARAGPLRARLVCPAQEEFKTQEMRLRLASPLAHIGPPEGPRLSSFYEGVLEALVAVFVIRIGSVSPQG